MKPLWSAIVALGAVIAGLWAAGLSHSLLWFATALGAISGPYTAYRHDVTITAVLAALAAACTIVVIGLGCTLARALHGHHAWFAALQRTLDHLGSIRFLIAVAAVQVVAIVSLESIEQISQLGHTLAPLSVFGGPLLIALPVHACCALFIVTSLLHALRAIVRSEVQLRRVIVALARRLTPVPAATARLDTIDSHHAGSKPAPLALRIANRPPPSIAA